MCQNLYLPDPKLENRDAQIANHIPAAVKAGGREVFFYSRIISLKT